MMDAVSATICDGGQVPFVILWIYIKPNLTALDQPLQMAVLVSHWGDSLN
jgi:hypothetical protein